MARPADGITRGFSQSIFSRIGDFFLGGKSGGSGGAGGGSGGASGGQ